MPLALSGSARTAGATHSDADSTPDFHAGVGALDLDEIQTIGSARMAGAGTFDGSSLAEATGLSGFGLLEGSAAAEEAGSTATTIARRAFRILSFYRV